MATAPNTRALLIDALWDGCFDKAADLRARLRGVIVCNHALWDQAWWPGARHGHAYAELYGE